MEKPKCFDTDVQWQQWSALNHGPSRVPKHHGYCYDCTPKYQAEMLRVERCSYPTVVFVIDKYDDLIGQRPRPKECRKSSTL